MADKILSPKFRGSYVSVIVPRRPKTGKGEAKYQATIVLPKGDPKAERFIKTLRANLDAAMMEKFGKVLPEKTFKHWPIRDGDDYVDEDGVAKEEFAGNWVISAKNSRPPGLSILHEDGTREEVEDRALVAEIFYSGAYYYASVNGFAWIHEEGGKGVSVSLSGLLWAGDGERFGGGGYSSNEFDAVARGEKKDDRTVKPRVNSMDQPEEVDL